MIKYGYMKLKAGRKENSLDSRLWKWGWVAHDDASTGGGIFLFRVGAPAWSEVGHWACQPQGLLRGSLPQAKFSTVCVLPGVSWQESPSNL